MNGLLFGQDTIVAKWVFHTFNLYEMPFNQAIGIVSPQGVLVGGILFHNFNGVNVELAYYGPGTMTLGIIRSIAKIALKTFNAARLTVVTSKRNRRFINAMLKLGFRLEGTQRCYFGHDDTNKNTGVRLALFKEQLTLIAGEGKKKCQSDIKQIH